MDVAEFESAMADENFIVLDVRTPEEHAEGHIAGTDFNIDVLSEGFTAEALAVLPKDRAWPYIVVVATVANEQRRFLPRMATR